MGRVQKLFKNPLRDGSSRVERDPVGIMQQQKTKRSENNLENSQNILIKLLQKDVSEIEAESTQLIGDVKTFASSTEHSKQKNVQ